MVEPEPHGTSPASALVSRILKLRLNRRWFWIGLGILAAALALLGSSYAWLLNGGFVAPWLLLHAARLHDLGRRGLWAVGAVTATLMLLIGLAMLRPPTAVYGPAAIFALLALAAFSLWVGTKRGDPSANQFGRAPVGWSLF